MFFKGEIVFWMLKSSSVFKAAPMSWYFGQNLPLFLYHTGDIVNFYASKHKVKYHGLLKKFIFCCSLHMRYTGVISQKKSVFSRTFLGSHLVILMKKSNFWKMKKKLSKIFKKSRFLAHLRAERLQCQPPDFKGHLFEHFHKVNDQKQVVWKIGIKGYPLYIQNFWTHFWPLFEGYFSNP